LFKILSINTTKYSGYRFSSVLNIMIILFLESYFKQVVAVIKNVWENIVFTFDRGITKFYSKIGF
jgi:hypothetical protein